MASFSPSVNSSNQEEKEYTPRRSGFHRRGNDETYESIPNISSSDLLSSASDDKMQPVQNLNEMNEALNALILETEKQSKKIDSFTSSLNALNRQISLRNQEVSNYCRSVARLTEEVEKNVKRASIPIGILLGFGTGTLVGLGSANPAMGVAAGNIVFGCVGTFLGMVTHASISLRSLNHDPINLQSRNQKEIWEDPNNPKPLLVSYDLPWDQPASSLFDPNYANALLDPNHPDFNNPFIPLAIQQKFGIFLKGFIDSNHNDLIVRFNLTPGKIDQCKLALFAITNAMQSKSDVERAAIIIQIMESLSFNETRACIELTELAYTLNFPAAIRHVHSTQISKDDEKENNQLEKNLVFLKEKIILEARLRKPILLALQEMRIEIFQEAVDLILQDNQGNQAQRIHTFSYYYVKMAKDLGFPEIAINQAGNSNLIYDSQESRIYQYFNEKYTITKIVKEIEKLLNQQTFLDAFKTYLSFFFKGSEEEMVRDSEIRFGSILNLL